jgi:hypothetical protein
MAYSGMLRRVALVRIDVSEELSASFIRVTRLGELGTTLAVNSNRRTLRRNTKCVRFHSLQTFGAVLRPAVPFTKLTAASLPETKTNDA